MFRTQSERMTLVAIVLLVAILGSIGYVCYAMGQFHIFLATIAGMVVFGAILWGAIEWVDRGEW